MNSAPINTPAEPEPTPRAQDISNDEAAAYSSLLQHFANAGTLGDLKGLEPRHYEAMYAIGHNHYQMGDYDRAVQTLGYLVMLNPWDRRFTMALAAAYQMKGEPAKALGYYGVAVALDMTDPIPIFHSAECLAAMGQYSDACEALGFVIRQSTTAAHQPYKERAQGLLPLMQAQAERNPNPASTAKG